MVCLHGPRDFGIAEFLIFSRLKLCGCFCRLGLLQAGQFPDLARRVDVQDRIVINVAAKSILMQDYAAILYFEITGCMRGVGCDKVKAVAFIRQ